MCFHDHLIAASQVAGARGVDSFEPGKVIDLVERDQFHLTVPAELADRGVEQIEGIAMGRDVEQGFESGRQHSAMGDDRHLAVARRTNGFQGGAAAAHQAPP
jgi:hypothetical protein